MSSLIITMNILKLKISAKKLKKIRIYFKIYGRYGSLLGPASDIANYSPIMRVTSTVEYVPVGVSVEWLSPTIFLIFLSVDS